MRKTPFPVRRKQKDPRSVTALLHLYIFISALCRCGINTVLFPCFGVGYMRGIYITQIQSNTSLIESQIRKLGKLKITPFSLGVFLIDTSSVFFHPSSTQVNVRHCECS